MLCLVCSIKTIRCSFFRFQIQNYIVLVNMVFHTTFRHNPLFPGASHSRGTPPNWLPLRNTLSKALYPSFSLCHLSVSRTTYGYSSNKKSSQVRVLPNPDIILFFLGYTWVKCFLSLPDITWGFCLTYVLHCSILEEEASIFLIYIWR